MGISINVVPNDVIFIGWNQEKSFSIVYGYIEHD